MCVSCTSHTPGHSLACQHWPLASEAKECTLQYVYVAIQCGNWKRSTCTCTSTYNVRMYPRFDSCIHTCSTMQEWNIEHLTLTCTMGADHHLSLFNFLHDLVGAYVGTPSNALENWGQFRVVCFELLLQPHHLLCCVSCLRCHWAPCYQWSENSVLA